MGLDLIAVSKLKRINEQTERKGTVKIEQDNMNLLDREPGIYEVMGNYQSKRMGSYSTYNRVRDVISKVIIGEPAEVVWATCDYKGHAVGHLVNFSDCDGIIDASYCRAIAADLRNYAIELVNALMVEFEEPSGAVEYYTEYVQDTIELFEIAGDDGCIIFS